MVLLAKNYHYIDFSEPKKFYLFILVFLAGPVAGRPAPGPGSRAGPEKTKKNEKKKIEKSGPAGRTGDSV